MNLVKRDCPVKIELKPCGSYYLNVKLEIRGDQHSFLPSGAMSFFFSEFMGAVYALYHEDVDCHHPPYAQNPSKRAKHTLPKDDPSLHDDEIRIESDVVWDEEGIIDTISFCRVFSRNPSFTEGENTDPVSVTVTYKYHPVRSGQYTYSVDGRDLCYAIGKAATAALKEYGFYGYQYATGCGVVESDLIDMNQLIFFKAYALNAMEARTLKKHEQVYSSSFQKELELILFDM